MARRAACRVHCLAANRLCVALAPCAAAQPSLVNVSITTINCSYPASQVVKCFLPIPVISTNPLAILLADPTAFLQSADKILLSVCCSDPLSRQPGGSFLVLCGWAAMDSTLLVALLTTDPAAV
jgi:hypothetical protein